MDQAAVVVRKQATKTGAQSPRVVSKSRIYGYLRVSTGDQDLDSQKVGIVDYSTKHDLSVTKYFEDTASGAVPASERTLGKELLPILRPNDVLIVAEISRLGRSLLDVLGTLKTLAEKKVRVHVVKNGFVLDESLNSRIITTVLGLTAEIERELLSLRVREGQTRARAAGKRIGRPKGSGGYSKLDKFAEQIKAHAAKGITKLNLARIYECDWITMNRWLSRHGVKIRKGAAR